MELWTVLILFLFGFSSTFSQSLTMSGMYAVTDCQAGLRANEDRLVFTGTVNATGVQYRLWQSNVSLIIGSPTFGRQREESCKVNIERCQHHEPMECYCTRRSEHVYNVFFNLTATEAFSSMSVKMSWPRRDLKQIMASNWFDVPKIYKAKNELNLLQVNLENISLSGPCKLPARHSLSYIQYCCFNAPSPCVSTILFQGMAVTGNPCAVGNFIIAPQTIYKFSHSVCGRESPKMFSCVGVSVASSNVQVDDEEATPLPSYNGYRNAAIFLASVIAIGLIIATVHRLDASLLFTAGPRRRMETMNIVR